MQKNTLKDIYPDIAKEWHPTKNNDLTPERVTPKSSKRVWWKCKNGHEWEAVIAHRSSGSGCPYCANKKVQIGYNDLATTDPELAAEWHPSKNGSLFPTDLTRGSGIKVWWICKKGHEWCTSPNKRTAEKNSCPYCSNKKVLHGYNDLATTNPKLAAEWHPTRNGILSANDVTESSGKKVWWKCSRGHSWQSSVCNRQKRNCPFCEKQSKTSFPEQALFYYIKKCFPDTQNGNTEAIQMELDIFIPSKNIAIEYDGRFYHQAKASKQREQKKNQLCIENGIRLIRVREKGLELYDDCECIVSSQPEDYLSIKYVIQNVLTLLGETDIDININRDLSDILGTYLNSNQKKNLKEVYPKLAEEWHPTKNGELKPEHLYANSGKKVWWICEKGHEWQASLHNRTKGKGCPYCSGRKAITGENDLAKCYPNLLVEWNYEKNHQLNPSKLKPGSDVKAWWKCLTCGYEWKTSVINRTNGRGCPKCAEQKKGPKRKTHEQYKQELSVVNNNIELIGDYIVSTKKVKCRCKICNNEWDALPGNLLKGKGCPVCARKNSADNKTDNN